ncbi:hypothetical protein PX699_02450 [Sphingobium sp. H39-3-25]|uniref:hypothetical protein n=1 Tax=Sphingobium arseniciresistens TaxID=3030834 RepID=UPI0023B98594|nr:hypothetical protein [Sphingobium arseniciresistens]
MSEHDPLALLNMLGARLPAGLAFELTGDNRLAEAHPLRGEIEAALTRATASLPYVRNEDVLWVTVAPTADALRRAIEDLRCWILPSYGWEARPAVVVDASGAGQMGALLLEQSPNGYFRWFSRRSDLDAVIARLAMMRTVIVRAPARESQLRPTLETLRRQFALSLAIGDRDLALAAVDEIDQRQLDSAPNSLGMRIRLAATFGDDEAIVSNPLLDNLLSMRAPRRVVESVLRAHHTVFLAAFEAKGDLDGALDAYGGIADRLAGLAGTPEVGADPMIVSMASYQAAVDEDAPRLDLLAARFPDNAVAVTLAEMLRAVPSTEGAPEGETFEVPEQPSVSEEAEPEGEAEADIGPGPQPVSTPAPVTRLAIDDWSQVPAALIAGDSERLKVFLAQVVLDPDGCDPAAGDFMFEIFADDAILADPARALEADQVLTTVIDAYICEDRFPRRERLPLYRTVLDVWSSSRAQSTDPVDGQLLLTISDALLRLDGKLEAPVALAIARWWEARAVRSRLAWLGESLELLTDESSSQDHLVLWYEGANLIRLDSEALSFADRHLWHRLGRRLGLDAAATDEALGGPLPGLGIDSDPLHGCSFTKIAIVSLHERAAREAAAQIEARTQANVIVVTDHAAGEGTASAATADVILFVWGATKHAVYRAFDKVRDRLEYVQGTGSASIVRALERRAKVESQPDLVK